jgi:NTE family protein
MKFLLLFFLIVSALFSQERPKIALVLSGGGARGGAHVGVLKVLEQNNIPIDMIVGTSMGAFVGGLYASGKTPQEIETMLISTDWKSYIRADFQRQDIPMRKKNMDYAYQGRLGMGINANGEFVVPTGVLKREPLLLKFMELTVDTQDIKDFDNLNIPYRAVATNIKNGDEVVLKSGSLAQAIYASSSIPGGFQPITIDGVDLVDGGVSDNFPIQVARDMGADVIIAVDVSENFNEKLDVNSYFVVMGQLVDILMRKNANESIKTLTDKDILLTPDLNGYSGIDADKYSEIIQKGVQITLSSKPKLEHLAISKKDYKLYKKDQREKHIYKAPTVDEINIINPTYISDDSIRRRLHQKVGDILDEKVLTQDILHLYNMMIFDSVDYAIENISGKNILFIMTTPSWDNHGEVRFALGLEDDFQGHSAYSLKVGYTMYGLNEYGGEWKNDFEIGRYQKAATEWFQPLDTMQRYYIRPSLSYSGVTNLLPTEEAGSQEVYSSRKGGTFAFGAHVGMSYEFEVGASLYEDYLRIDFASLFGAPSIYYQLAKPIYARINIDNLDNVNFPTVGVKSELRWTKEMSSWGSDYDYEQISFEFEKPFRFYSNNLTFYAKYGNTYKDDNTFRMEGLFMLGGLFNLSGYSPYSFIGNNVALGVLKYTYEIKDGGFFGTLNAPLYLGFSLESGQTWNNGDKVNFDTIHKSGTVYVAADTFLGPLYLAYGSSADGKQSAYLYLGEKF